MSSPLYVVHVMSMSAADTLVSNAERNRTFAVYGETLAAALGSDGSNYRHHCWEHAAAHILSPPLRPDPRTGDHLATLLAQ